MEYPNIVWITLESVRADHTTIGSYERNTTPKLDEIAGLDESIKFDRCYSHSNWTPPASASIMSGLYPSQHGVVRSQDGTVGKLDPSVDTMASLFSELGYKTALFTPNPYLSSSTNLDMGFEDVFKINLSDIRKKYLLRYIMRIRKYGPGFAFDKRRHNRTFITAEMVKDYVNSTENPFFIYVHINSPHHPYTPPNKFRIKSRNQPSINMSDAISYSLSLFGGDLGAVNRKIGRGVDISSKEMDMLKLVYDSEILFADWAAYRIFKESLDLSTDTITVITGDHGELFGEGGMLGHRVVLNQASLNVPAIVHGITGVENVDTNAKIQHIDLREMLLSDLEISDESEGIDPRENNRDHYLSQRNWSDLSSYTKFGNFDISKYHRKNVSFIKSDKCQIIEGDNRCDVGDYIYNNDKNEPKLTSIMEKISWDKISQSAEFSDDARSRLSDLGYV